MQRRSFLMQGGMLFFFNDTATTEIYTLSLHDALPISQMKAAAAKIDVTLVGGGPETLDALVRDRKSTRLNSSHLVISYAVFCLKKKNRKDRNDRFIYHRWRAESRIVRG